jgi:hypothetical protein
LRVEELFLENERIAEDEAQAFPLLIRLLLTGNHQLDHLLCTHAWYPRVPAHTPRHTHMNEFGRSSRPRPHASKKRDARYRAPQCRANSVLLPIIFEDAAHPAPTPAVSPNPRVSKRRKWMFKKKLSRRPYTVWAPVYTAPTLSGRRFAGAEAAVYMGAETVKKKRGRPDTRIHYGCRDSFFFGHPLLSLRSGVGNAGVGADRGDSGPRGGAHPIPRLRRCLAPNQPHKHTFDILAVDRNQEDLGPQTELFPEGLGLTTWLDGIHNDTRRLLLWWHPRREPYLDQVQSHCSCLVHQKGEREKERGGEREIERAGGRWGG